MRIGIVSDTHLSARTAANGLPTALIKGLQGVDRILHAGDWVSLEVAALLERIAPVDGVSGNNDGDEIASRFGRRKTVETGGIRIGLVHGDGTKGTTLRRAEESFRGERVDVIVFGHSHIPYLEERMDGVLLFNPGSPTDKRKQPLFSYGLLTIDENGVRAEHRFYERIDV